MPFYQTEKVFVEICENFLIWQIEYKSSHKLRKAHGVYAVEHSDNYQEFQAYSQNMGHEDPGTTYRYYSKLSNDDVKSVILKNFK